MNDDVFCDDFFQQVTITAVDEDEVSDEEKRSLSDKLTDFLFSHTLIPRNSFVKINEPFLRLFHLGSETDAAERVFDALSEFSKITGKSFFIDYFFAEDYLAGGTFIELGEVYFHSEVVVDGERKVNDTENRDFNKEYLNAQKDYLAEYKNHTLMDEIDKHDIHTPGYWENFSEADLIAKGFIKKSDVFSALRKNCLTLLK